MIRQALLILSGNTFTSVVLLARNLIVARLIPVADYGIATTFATVMAVVEMASALGLQQQIVQARDGDDPHFQAALQGFQALRGVLSGLVLVALAVPMAQFLGLPQVAWAYALLAAVPVVSGLVHFDIHRLNRNMVFGPLILSRALPALVAVVALWPLSLWLPDWRMMLASILIQSLLGAAVPLLLAERRFRLVFDREIMGRSLRFGWPLLVNGLLLFLVFQGEKLIVGREIGMEPLAIFALGMTFTLTPTMIVASSAQNFFAPQLARAFRERQGFAPLSAVVIEAVILLGLLFVLAVVLLGTPAVTILLGPRYAALGPLLPLMAVMQAIRLFKVGPAIVALAAGHTGNAMIANGVRVLSFPLAWQVALATGDLVAIVWVMIAGELAAHATAMLMLVRRPGLPLALMLKAQIWPGVFLGVAAFGATAPEVLAARLPGLGLEFVALPAMILALAASLWSMRDLRAWLKRRRA